MKPKLVLCKDQQNWQDFLARLAKKKREKTQKTKIRSESGNGTTNPTGKKRVIREHREQLSTNKLDSLDEVDKFLETHKLPKQTQKK